MNVYCINLDDAHERRPYIESCFTRFAPPGYSLRRIPACAPHEVGDDHRGNLQSKEKACILSHTKAVRASLDHENHALILEDDASLGRAGFGALTALLNSDMRGSDLIFLNSLVTNADFIFLKQYNIYRRAVGSNNVALLDMKGLESAGADAYVVNHDAKSKLLRLLSNLETYDVPYDLLLKNWIQSGALTAKLTLPFVTSLSALSDRSQITEPNPDWNNYRRLFSLESEYFINAQIEKGMPPDAAVDAFTNEHLSFLKLLLTKYSSY